MPMPSFDAPSLPSPIAMRECTRPRFDGNLDKLSDWLADLSAAGVRQAGPTLMLALENLRKASVSANRRLSVLSALKVPVLKTCAGLPKPFYVDGEKQMTSTGVTLELKLCRLMFVNLDLALRQLDEEHETLSKRQRRKRRWAVRNLYRFANRQIRYSALWKTPLAPGAWRDLHALHYYLRSKQPGTARQADIMESSGRQIGFEVEYKQLLLFGLAARLKESVIRSEYFLDGLEGWAVLTRLEDPHAMIGRLGLFLVEIKEDQPPRQMEGCLEMPFQGWVLQPPYPYVHELEDAGYGLGAFGYQSRDLTF